MLQERQIGFLGAGSVAEALVGGLLQAGLVTPEQILLTNRSNRDRLEAMAERFAVHVTPERRAVVDASDILVIACKPKDVAELLTEVGRDTRNGQVILSVAAGISTSSIAALVHPGAQIVRAMPNTSSFVRESATAISKGPGCGDEAMAIARAILGGVGTVVEVEEHDLDAVTGLSGSGPAYIYLMIEALTEAGINVGLAPETAKELATQTLVGAAKMLQTTGEDPAVLRQKVTSPQGTTYAGLQVLAENGFNQAVVKAVGRATQRSRELGALLAAPQKATAGD